MFEGLKNLFFSSWKSITTGDLEAILAKRKITLLDVRTSQEYRGGHIEGAKNIPLQAIDTYQGKRSDPVYIICHSGMRSRQATGMLRKKGYEAINVKGGMLAYKGKIV